MLEIRRLKVLREVALRGSITAAAEALSYTPSAVSQQIAALEREMSAVLVERGPHSIALTEAGHILVEHTEGVLEHLELADEQVKAIAGLRGGRLRLATFRSAGETLVAQALMDFHRAWPAVELRLAEGEPEEYLHRVAAGEFDLALSFDYDGVPPPHDDTLACEDLLTEEMLIALPEGHRLADGPSVALADLSEEPWITSSVRSSVHEFTAIACGWEGFEPHVAFEIDDYHMAQALVAAGVGVTFIPALSTHTANPHLRVLPVRPRPPRRRVCLVSRESESTSPCVAEMTRLLRLAAAALSTGER
ncbi:LysR family transcriptional regulator [Spongiactinospora rosea]|uniref:LysR family transcriptional regulator n=1 Tax=Spongiactinospora rosea TaxID=2248750 RepID=UPI001314ED64|nr:LysR family transcriptional regulator [Spongiactinospora rosea]